jgi:cysteine desulfurase/selenocysteine lyase
MRGDSLMLRKRPLLAMHAPLSIVSPAPGAAIDWAAWRADFPILDQEVHGRPLVYLDSAASSQKP